MKLALRWIPAEVWVDVFVYPWITREELGRIVHRFRNHYICEILQYCLHERGKRTLKKIDLRKTLNGIPLTPLPENIKFFEQITIRHFDSRTLDFLRHASGLFTNAVNLCFYQFGFAGETKLRTVLDHLTPLLHRIHSLTFNHRFIPLVEAHFAQKLAHIKTIEIHLVGRRRRPFENPTTLINFCLNWLILSDGREQTTVEPKYLVVYMRSENFQQFAMAIQQQFLSAKSPCTFLIRLTCFGIRDTNFRLELENNIGEQLHGEFDRYEDFWFARHPAVDFERSNLEEWAKETRDKQYTSSRIEFARQLTIGQIDTNGSENGVNNVAVEEEEADQPSTSE